MNNANTIKDFISWFVNRHGDMPRHREFVVTAMCGHCHTYTKEAEKRLSQAVKEGLISETKGIIMFKTTPKAQIG